MKRHHVVAVLCLIFGGLLAYTRFHGGDTAGAIRTGIIFALLGIFAFFYHGNFRTRFRPVVVCTARNSPRFNGGICGFHGEYSECNYSGDRVDFRGNPDVVSRHTVS